MKYWVFDLDGTLTDSFGPYFTLVENLIMEAARSFEHNQLEQVGKAIGITTIAHNLINSFSAQKNFVSVYNPVLKIWEI